MDEVTCPACGIRYARWEAACPQCGHPRPEEADDPDAALDRIDRLEPSDDELW